MRLLFQLISQCVLGAIALMPNAGFNPCFNKECKLTGSIRQQFASKIGMLLPFV